MIKKIEDLKIKIFSDGADKKDMLDMNNKTFIKGLTTNPSLMKKAGIKDYEAFAKDILSTIKEKPISFEVFADDYKNMKTQAHKITKWGKNVYVKIPVINSKGKFMGKIIKELNQNNIKINITAVYSYSQVKNILNLINKKSKVIISIFAGRAADSGKDTLPLFKKSISRSKKFKNVSILWASVREPYNYLQAKQLGCHIITIPPSIIEKIMFFGKTFNYLTINTVKNFLIDSKKSKFKI